MNKSFKHLIRYHFYNYIYNINKDKIFNDRYINKTFIEHLINIIKTDKNLNRTNIEKKVDEINKLSNINEINNEIISIINELNIEYTGNSDIKLGITADNINDMDNEDILDFEIMEDNDDIDKINPVDIIKLFYSFHRNNNLCFILKCLSYINFMIINVHHSIK